MENIGLNILVGILSFITGSNIGDETYNKASVKIMEHKLAKNKE